LLKRWLRFEMIDNMPLCKNEQKHYQEGKSATKPA